MARGRGRGRGAARGRGRPPGRGRGRGRGPAASSTSSGEPAGANAEEVASATQDQAVASAAHPVAEAQAASAIVIQNLQREIQQLRQQVQAAPPAAPAAPAPVAEPVVAVFPPEARMSLREWSSLRLDTFDGAGTPVHAADWLRHMERQFGALEMTSVQKARFVAFQLKGQADIWWEGVLSARAPVQGPATWEVFVE